MSKVRDRIDNAEWGLSPKNLIYNWDAAASPSLTTRRILAPVLGLTTKPLKKELKKN